MAASARIVYKNTGIQLAVNYIILAQQNVARAKALADSVTNGGVDTVNLEGSAEFSAATGQGGTLYTAIANLNANLATITAASLAKLDQG